MHGNTIAGLLVVSWYSLPNLYEKADSNFSQKRFLTDPHQTVGLIRFALVFNAAEAVAPLAVISLVVVVKFYLPHSLKDPSCLKL